MREEKAKEYRKNLWLQSMDKKRRILREKKEKENEEKAEKKKIKEEINKDKQVMMERLKEIMKSGEEYSKDEINEYVLNGIKPKSKSMKKYDRNKTFTESVHKRTETKEKEDEDDYEGDQAFITSVPEKEK